MSQPVHSFHIPVMGTGFTVDTPLKVARFGIASVVSLVDDVLLEQMRERLCEEHDEAYEAIADGDEDARARRITAYLDLLDLLIGRQMERLRTAVFAKGSDLVRYFELLPPSPLRAMYERMHAATEPAVRHDLQQKLRTLVVPGSIDVNIMTKLDRDRSVGENASDALSALRGFMNSRLDASVVLSAGMNRRLFAYLAEFGDRLAGDDGSLRKRIVLKVGDYRSALLQGKLLARLGLHVSEFRIESGLNCGGHAFGGKGQLLGTVLDEFRREKDSLVQTLRDVRQRALTALGRSDESDEPPRVTVQGGLGDPDEDRLLREHYGVDGTGWGSAFLFVPEVVNVDPTSLASLVAASEDDIHLSGASPLGVPFWLLQTSSSEDSRRRRIADGRPGSTCPKGYVAFDTEFTTAPLCTASRGFQRRKLAQIAAQGLTDTERNRAEDAVTARACLCHDLAGGITGPTGIDPAATTAVCCGPNAAYFETATTLDAMVDHIYGRARLPLAAGRPHMLLKELSLHVDALRRDLAAAGDTPTDRQLRDLATIRENLEHGIAHYRDLATRFPEAQRDSFLQGLERLARDLEMLFADRDEAGC